jgi:hypothetical protein
MTAHEIIIVTLKLIIVSQWTAFFVSHILYMQDTADVAIKWGEGSADIPALFN